MPPEQVAFRDNQVCDGQHGDAVPEFVKKAVFRAGVAVLDRLLQDAGHSLGSGQGARGGRSTTSPMARRAAKC